MAKALGDELDLFQAIIENLCRLKIIEIVFDSSCLHVFHSHLWEIVHLRHDKVLFTGKK